ncbi:DUF4252 domain-containing protein [Gillisia limnaea]|uniref:Membrane or secreted protein n=1 Tax=Gillisia limnaea (strain DSM 15749 / LMG 21470 / R-8282) TaxID=865937 RepID=H2BWW0_GILLR|nr:DUF4252 domain-containing protein [Gillisia limnaea]EHQ04133.1 membrane or secreted protein [Gillisia limnaea DSM 15749]
MKSIKFIGLVALGLLFSCNNEESLQQYYVANQGNNEFVAIDVPTSMFTSSDSLSPEQKATMETIKKINLLAIPKKAENIQIIEDEQIKISEILKNEKYELLMRYGGGDTRVEIYYTGDEEAVDEIIVYGFDQDRGMGLARVLGDDMNPGDILSLFRSLEKGDIDMDGLKGITSMFIEKTE